ncbi:hypothetical protein BV898_12472 [Hypsibius exemplaris]|uniref:Cupin-like domain-containing protein n=1 Tax=Hypsibius exemplaris TaxID=2072580 RepID=A0A1W0WDH5_HYPEX|nr:hypothetical protein BV898_12472 [Hypsibius exemplaris]
MANVAEDLQKLYDEIGRLKPTEGEMKLLPDLERLLEVSASARDCKSTPTASTTSKRCLILAFLVACSAVLAYCLTAFFPHFTVASIHALGYGEPENPNSPCFLRGPAKMTEIFRSPVDCSVCRNVTRVDISRDMSVEQFTKNYAYTSRPLVVRGALRDWTASKVFSFDFLRHLYLDEFPGSLDVVAEHCQFFKYKTEFANLRDVLTMSKERFNQTWYVGWSNCDVSVATVLRDHYTPPTFLPAGSASSRLDWIFMGRSGNGANIHIDNVGKPSWQAQIKGTKVWTLEPPRECHFECASMEVTVYPNDIIVLDTDTWYHGTTILGDEISITIGSEYD